MPEIDVSAWHVLPLAPKEDAEVEREVAKMLAAVAQDTVEEYLELPGLSKLEGREALAGYEMKLPEQWGNEYASAQNETISELRNWARLSRKYREMDEAGRLVPV